MNKKFVALTAAVLMTVISFGSTFAMAETAAQPELSEVQEKDKSENNASTDIKNPTTIKLGQWNTGYLKEWEGENYYTFTLTKPGYISLTMENANNNTYQGIKDTRWYYDFYKNNDLVWRSAYSDDINSKTDRVGLNTGTYILKLDCIGSGTEVSKQYKFKIDFTHNNYWEKEPNGDFDTATPMVLNTNYYGSSSGYYVINVNTSGYYNVGVVLDNKPDGFASVSIYDKNKNLKKNVKLKGNYVNNALVYPTSFNTGNVYLSAGKYYVYIDGSDAWNGFRFRVNSVGTTVQVTVPAPTNVQIRNRNAYSLRVQWNEVAGASAYEIWRATSYGGTYTKIATVSGRNYYINSQLQVARPYYYKIRAKSGSAVSGYTKFVGGRTLPITQSAISVTKRNSTSATVKWAKSSGATGYEVWRSTSANGTYTRVAAVSGISRVDSGLKSGQAYYYKIRAYTTYGGVRHYGRFTVIRGVRM